MKIFDRMTLMALVAFVPFLAACGFTPQYASTETHTAAQGMLRAVDIPVIPDASGVFLRNQLMDRFYAGGRASPLYRLNVDPIREGRQDLDITIDEEATRRQIRVETEMTLVRTDTNAVLTRRHLYALASYNILQSQFTTRITEQNARENALADLARQMEQTVLLTLSTP